MTHLTEEQLVLYYLGESEQHTEARAHLDECAACRADLAAVQRTLNLLDTWETPERGPEYGTQVWNQLRPRLGIRARFFSFQWVTWSRAAATACVALLVVGAYMLGRVSPRPTPAPQPIVRVQTNRMAADRMLLVSVGDHLEQSQRVLLELANAHSSELPTERDTAEQLLLDNRLMRQSLQLAGDRNMASVLERLERFLTEAANARPDELPDIQRRMVDEGVLFQLRVANAKIHERQRAMLPVASN
ncbi:hypothetical protein [uncultured Paludibaculum sp.]|uniref:hypothetical protein n=1 Tax=uncultured Paludibaculum sp. TaxID=1765020 RepID=UPI002AABB1CB|nr:hypothetical protein [uncultured Paludibaculum sp.]